MDLKKLATGTIVICSIVAMAVGDQHPTLLLWMMGIVIGSAIFQLIT